jgi:2-polyprenyl-6-methoxyphenol hydroxylase-like FAD-dependent oxidoreductase
MHTPFPAAPHSSASVLIIGGGIGGIAAALAFHRVGIRVRVFERAPELSEVGAGLALWMNALRVLDQLGVGQRIRRLGAPLHVAEICSSGGAVLSRFEFGDLIPDVASANYVLHRADLHAALLEQLPAGVLVTGSECVGVEQDADRAVAHFRHRAPEHASLLIGADGLGSAVRVALRGSDPVRYSGQTCYRGIAPLAPADPHVLREVQGAGQRAAVCPLDERRVYWWAALNAPPGELDDPAARKQALLERFRGWPCQVPEAIAASTGTILRNDLVDRAPLKRWSDGRITLLGDAAHPMLPNLGQGACTAIEDSLVLARAVARHGATPRALQVYEAERIPRTTSLVRQSWQFGVPVRWTHPWAVRLREQLIRRTPAAFLALTLRQQIGYDVGLLAQGRDAA